jgi:4-aminobutyrate aminotransferase / (S)-3-amino-2-methylpropionate transaminase / 5-aminovalerate transaminase
MATTTDPGAHRLSAGASARPRPIGEALFEDEQQYIAPGIQTIALLSKLAIEKGEGARLTDVDGNTYLDFNVGVSVCSLGYSHPKYVEAMARQLSLITVGSFTSRPRLDLVKLIAEVSPGRLHRSQFFSGGAEAVEAALRLARSHTKKMHVFGFWGGFHGKTAGVMPLSSVDWKHETGPLPAGYHQTTYADCYRCPLKLEYPQCALACAELLREQIAQEAKGNVAAVIVEPIQGTAGNIVPPPGYIAAVRDIAHEAGALFISDEMITGFGRTGKMFGCDHDDVEPDIMTIGKGMGSGFPVAGVVTSDEISRARPWSLPSASSSSYGGNPLASAAALISIRTIVDDQLVERSARVGAVLLDALTKLKDKHRSVGDVRGKGLLIGIDLVKNRQTREPWPKAWCEAFFHEAMGRGLILMGYSPRVRIHPPLILSEAEALEGAAIIDEALEAVEAQVG